MFRPIFLQDHFCSILQCKLNTFPFSIYVTMKIIFLGRIIRALFIITKKKYLLRRNKHASAKY